MLLIESFQPINLRTYSPLKDEGVAEAFRRDAEIEANRAKAISLTELDFQSGAGVAEGTSEGDALKLSCESCSSCLKTPVFSREVYGSFRQD